MRDLHLERAQQLVSTGRFAEAERELKNVLATDPERPDALALFAICKAEQGEVEEALSALGGAIRNQPDNDYFLYLNAFFHFKNRNFMESEKELRNAIAFNPNRADYFGLLSAIKQQQKDWGAALQYANEGLEKDGDNLQCLNARSTALHKLGRKEESYVTIKHALEQDPENEMTHTNLGWSLLEQGKEKQALEHFREALKLNPDYAYAKAGLVEALKARYIFYKVFLKYAFWISNMRAKGQWFVILGLYFGVKLLRIVADMNSTLGLILTPIIWLYFAFAISTWLIEPLSNLFLRLNVYGRYALTREEILSSNFVATSLLIGLAGGLMLLFNDNIVFLMICIYGLTMMIPLASMFNPVSPGKQKVLFLYAGALAIIGAAGIFLQAVSGDASFTPVIYIIGIVAYQWVANALTIR